LTKRIAVAVAWFKVRWVVIGHDGELIGRIVPQIVAAAQPTEPEVIAFIGDNGDRINVAVILLVRAVNHASTRANSPLALSLYGARCGSGKDAQCQKFEFGHNPFFPVVK